MEKVVGVVLGSLSFVNMCIDRCWKIIRMFLESNQMKTAVNLSMGEGAQEVDFYIPVENQVVEGRAYLLSLPQRPRLDTCS